MISGLLVFAATYAVAVASPGPGVAAIIARVLAKGTSGMPAFVAGFIVGDLFWFALTAAGLAAVAQTFATLFIAIKYAGAAYLLYMAWKLWTAPPKELARHEGGPRERESQLFLGALALTLSNPKSIVFFLAILPSVISLENMSLDKFTELAGLIVVILSLVFGGYILLAARARRLFTSPTSVQRLNRGTSVVMVGAAVAIAAR